MNKQKEWKTAKGLIINADVHAGMNIIRKVFPNAFSKQFETKADRIAVHGLVPKSLSISCLM